MCLASFRMTPRPAMIDTQQHPPTSSTMKWKAQKNSAQAVPSGESSHSLPQSSLPGQWRRRRNSLVVVTKHQDTSTIKVIMYVLRAPVTTPTQSPTSPFSNLMMSWMTLRCSGPVPAQPSSLGNLMVSWMSFATSVPTHDGPVALFGPKPPERRETQ